MMEGPAIVRAKSDRLWPGAQLFARLFVYQIPSRFPVFFFSCDDPPSWQTN